MSGLWGNMGIATMIGAVAFFASGGNPYVGMLAFTLTAGVMSYINPVTPDIDSPGQPEIGEFRISSATEGAVIPDLLGTTKCTGNIFYYFGERAVEQTETAEGGKGMGSSQEYVTGYKYYLSWCMGMCLGPVDTLYSVYAGEELVWNGVLEVNEFGYETITLDNLGSMTFYFGTDNQPANDTVGESLIDPNLNPAYRGLCYAFFDDVCVGRTPSCPVMRFVLGKRPKFGFNIDEEIGLDCNPAHAICHILTDEMLVGLDESMVDNTTFSDVADTAYNEGRGISLLMDMQQPATTYIESILTHVGGMLSSSADD